MVWNPIYKHNAWHLIRLRCLPSVSVEPRLCFFGDYFRANLIEDQGESSVPRSCWEDPRGASMQTPACQPRGPWVVFANFLTSFKINEILLNSKIRIDENKMDSSLFFFFFFEHGPLKSNYHSYWLNSLKRLFTDSVSLGDGLSVPMALGLLSDAFMAFSIFFTRFTPPSILMLSLKEKKRRGWGAVWPVCPALVFLHWGNPSLLFLPPPSS